MGALLKEILHSKSRSCRPTKLLSEFVKVHSEFKGNLQHDSHEFLGILLDSLHEDLNRRAEETNLIVTDSLKNPTSQQEIQSSKEQWEQLQGERGSVISDLCGGQIRNCLSCKSCGDKRVVFEHFMDLSVPIPLKDSDVGILIIFVSRNMKNIKRIKFRISKDDPLEALLESMQTKTNINPNCLIFGYVQEGFILKLFQPQTIEEFVPKRKNCHLFAFEIINKIKDAEKDGKLTLKSRVEDNWRENLHEKQMIDYLYIGKGWVVGQIQQITGNNVELEVESDSAPTFVVKKNSSSLAPFRTHTTNDDSIIHICLSHARRAKTNEYYSLPMVISIGN